jgi:phytoene dehydrogenase-like protein
MGLWQSIVNILSQFSQPPPADTSQLQASVDSLQELVNFTQQHPFERGMNNMTTPSDLVSISQADLTNFASEISAAVAVLAPYIQQLLAGQAVTLSPADESAVTAAITSLQGLEPPAPAPSS